MYKLLVALLFFFILTSCEEKNEKPRAKNPPGLLSYSKAKNIVGDYTGRHDTTLYLHHWTMNLDEDTANENVIVSEMLSDPNPLVSVYFKKKDTLIFIPVPAVSGTTPEVNAITFLHQGRKELAISYTRREHDGTYSYCFAAYSIQNFVCVKLFDIQLYTISKEGTINDALVYRMERGTDFMFHLRFYKAEANKMHTEQYMNKGPQLIQIPGSPLWLSEVYIEQYNKKAAKEKSLFVK